MMVDDDDDDDEAVELLKAVVDLSHLRFFSLKSNLMRVWERGNVKIRSRPPFFRFIILHRNGGTKYVAGDPLSRHVFSSTGVENHESAKSKKKIDVAFHLSYRAALILSAVAVIVISRVCYDMKIIHAFRTELEHLRPSQSGLIIVIISVSRDLVTTAGMHGSDQRRRNNKFRPGHVSGSSFAMRNPTESGWHLLIICYLRCTSRGSMNLTRGFLFPLISTEGRRKTPSRSKTSPINYLFSSLLLLRLRRGTSWLGCLPYNIHFLLPPKKIHICSE